MAFTKKEQTEAKKRIKKLLKEFDTKTVFVIQRHMSKSGMTRWLDLYLMPSYKSTHFTPLTITYEVAKALNWPYDFKKEALKVRGWGMDIHYHTVNSLSYALFLEDYPKGDKAGYILKKHTIV